MGLVSQRRDFIIRCVGMSHGQITSPPCYSHSLYFLPYSILYFALTGRLVCPLMHSQYLFYCLVRFPFRAYVPFFAFLRSATYLRVRSYVRPLRAVRAVPLSYLRAVVHVLRVPLRIPGLAVSSLQGFVSRSQPGLRTYAQAFTYLRTLFVLPASSLLGSCPYSTYPPFSYLRRVHTCFVPTCRSYVPMGRFFRTYVQVFTCLRARFYGPTGRCLRAYVQVSTYLRAGFLRTLVQVFPCLRASC